MTARRRMGRLQPRLDPLEHRLALTASTGQLSLVASTVVAATVQQQSPSAAPSLSIASVTPISSSTPAASPSTLSVTFDRPLNGAVIGYTDFRLVHVAGDGSTSTLGLSEANLVEAMDPSDPSGSRITLTLSKPLASGRYQLILSGDSIFQGQDGTMLAGAGTDLVIDDFVVGTKGTGLSAAVDLGTASATEMVRADTLALASNPQAVDLYKVTLAPGHFWRLGLAVSSREVGGSLQSVLSLFDSKGHLISTDNVGLSNSPGDPYLFAGLGHGTYYIGVSGRGTSRGRPAVMIPRDRSPGPPASSRRAGSSGSTSSPTRPTRPRRSWASRSTMPTPSPRPPRA